MYTTSIQFGKGSLPLAQERKGSIESLKTLAAAAATIGEDALPAPVEGMERAPESLLQKRTWNQQKETKSSKLFFSFANRPK